MHSLKIAFALLVLSASIITSQAQAPAFSWAVQSESDFLSEGADITTDSYGNTYTVGSFTGKIILGSDTLTSLTQGLSDILLVKHDQAGNVVWAKRAGGINGDWGTSILLDASGNIYITGTCSPSLVAGTATNTLPTNAFISKYDNAGNVLWSRKTNGSYRQQGKRIAVDASGNCFLSGSFTDTLRVGNNTFYAAGNGSDMFLAKYDANGTFQWIRSAGGLGSDHANGLAVDAAGNSYLTGFFDSPAYFGSHQLTTPYWFGLFMAKYDPAGNVSWVNQVGIPGQKHIYDMVTDADGYFYLLGGTHDVLPIGNYTPTWGGSWVYFIAKLDPAGNIVWANGGDTPDIQVSSLAVNSKGECYITGAFTDTVTLSNTVLTPGPYHTPFIIKYDSLGNFDWAKQPVSVLDVAGGSGIAADPAGNCVFTGFVQDGADFDGISLANNGVRHIFIAKAGNGILSSEGSISQSNDLLVYPNPAKGLVSVQLSTLETTENVHLELVDFLGKTLAVKVIPFHSGHITSTLSLDGLSAGVYFLKARTGKSVFVKKLKVD